MPASAELAQVWKASETFWGQRFAKMGDAAVGRVKENHLDQKKRIEDLLRPRLAGSHYEKALDFGCGYGRFTPLLSQYCGHIWNVDILANQLPRAGSASFNVTSVKYEWPNELPLSPHSIDLLLVVSVFHFMTNDQLFEACTSELRRVVKPGGTVLVIENAVDRDGHVKPRPYQQLAQALGLVPDKVEERVTVNLRPNDHWLINGKKA